MNANVKYLQDGRVELTFENGDYYIGPLVNNTITGNGYMKYADGRTYEGNFTNDRWDGYGNAYFPSNKSRYEGFWKDNIREGKGTTTFYNDDGSIFAVHDADYHNDIVDGSLRSEFYSDGTLVSGDHFKDYEAIGPVTIYYGFQYFEEDLRCWQYEGYTTYENNWYVRNGHGILTSPEGYQYEGNFNNNVLEGRGTMTDPDGKVKEVTFKNNKVQDENIKDIKNPAKAEKKDSDKPQAFRSAIKPDDPGFLHVNYRGNAKYSDEIEPYFEDIIGMESVKDQLDRMYKRFKIDAMRKAQLGLNSAKQGYYFIITGNPGTGKTTVARIIGKMLHDLGLLGGENFVEVDRSGLVGQYIGQTALKTSEVIQSAREGTLFVDEAYSLFKKDDDKDFGIEAIDTLLKDMEDHRGEYCCILAGYDDRMDSMIRNANPGLASRFDHKIRIDDYSSDELLDILVNMAEGKYFFIRKEAKPVIVDLFEKERAKPTFANARFARKILDEAIEAQAMRLSDLLEERKGGSLNDDELQTLEASDFMDADGL